MKKSYLRSLAPNSLRVLVAILFSTSLFLISCQTDTYLIRNGASDFSIFVSPAAPAPEQYAARELQEYLQKISGVKLPIINEVKENAPTIYVGLRGAPAHLLKNDNSLPNEHYVLRSDGKSLLIAGGGSRGTLYGVIGYLSDHLGCRWYTREVHKIPTRNEITLAKFEEYQKPAFELREAWYQEAYDPHWAVHNRLNPSIQNLPDSLGGNFRTYPFGHTFYNLVPPAQYFGKHPDYFSLVNGKRQKEKAQLCLSNPGMRAVAVETLFNWIKERPDVEVFSVDQNDYIGYCECPNCKAVDEREGGPTGSVIDFVNYVADTLASVYPNLKIQTFAYTYSEAPPTHLKPRPNVNVRLCRYNYCSAHGIDECDHSKPFRDRYEAWMKITNNISVWDYFTDFAQYLMPYPNFASVIRNVKWYAEKGAIGLFAQGNKVKDNGGGEFSELRAWLFAQLMWDPKRDGDALVREFVENVYGEAAPYIQTYIDMMHADVKADTSHFSIWAAPVEVNYLKPSLIKKADSLFTLAAQAVAEDSALSSRVELAYLPVMYTKLYFYSIGGSSYLTAPEMPALYERFERIRNKHQIKAMGDMPATYGNIEAFLEKVRTAPHYITEWQIAGPFDNEDQKGLTRAFVSENSVELGKSYEGKGGKPVKWEPYKNELSGYIDFTKIFTPSDYMVAYAYHNLKSESARTAKFGIGSNDGIRVWVNHKLVLDHPGSRKAEPNQDIITVPLQEGDNHILVKVDQLERGWGFYFGELK